MNSYPNANRSPSQIRKTKKILYTVAAICILLAIVYLYLKYFSPIDGGKVQTQNYWQAKARFAEMISNEISSNQKNYRIVAIRGPIYKPGYVLDPDNPVDLVTEACTLSTELLVESEWAPLPGFTAETLIVTDLQTTAKLIKFTKSITDLGGKVERMAKGRYMLQDIKQRVATQDVFENALQNDECEIAIQDRDVIIVRGIILAKEYFSTSDKISAEAETTVTRGNSVVVKVGRKGNFSLEDREPIPRFHIITAMTGLGPTRGENEIEELLRAPTDAQIEKLGGIVFEGQ